MHALALLSAILGLTSAAIVDLDSRQDSSTTACNNSPALCNRNYDQITHLGAHDSPFVRDASTGYSTSGDQYYNSTVQLSAGVRLLSAQVHKSNGEWHLCHSACDLLDAGLLSHWLAELKSWLDSNPNEVVTLLVVNSDKASADQLHAEFTKSQITSYAYTPPSTSTPPDSWPTLAALIAANTRLLVFVASLDTSSISSSQSYLMDEFTFIFENPYANIAFTDFTCTPDRPSGVQGQAEAAIASKRMPFMNHFLYQEGLFDIQTPDVGNITTTNNPGSSVGMLGLAASTCKTVYGKAPTFILVDFFDQGPAIDVVDSLNGVTNPVGRIAVPARDPKADSGSSSRADTTFSGVLDLVAQVQAGETPKLGAWIWAAGRWSWGGINLSGGNVLQK